MKCSECGYYWKEEDEAYANYKYDSNSSWPAPCEYEDDYEEPRDSIDQDYLDLLEYYS